MSRQLMAEVLAVASKQFKVLNAIILLVLVLMMDYFGWEKQAADVLLHHDSMFKDVAAVLGERVFWHVNMDIAIQINHPATTPLRIISAGESFRKHAGAAVLF